MKNTKLILLMALIATTLFSAVIFTSCTKKTTCGSVACRNNGTCTNGSCVCPAGFFGDFCEVGVTSYISYKNNTFTPIILTINGVAQTVPVGQSAAISGKFGTTAVGTATTSGAASSLGIDAGGGIIGIPINWDIKNDFPSTANDTLKQPLDVGASYYFLRMVNKSSLNVINYTANTLDSAAGGLLLQNVTVPNTGVTYDLGYYLAYPTSNVKTTSSAGKTVTTGVTLPFTSNQTFTATIN